MKKIIYSIISVLIIVIIASFFHTSDFLNRSHFNKLIAQGNDSLFMSEYLSGFRYADKVKPLADDIAYYRAMNKTSYSITYSIKERDEKNKEDKRFIKVAFAVLEKTRGVDSTANLIYNNYKFDYENLFSGYQCSKLYGGESSRLNFGGSNWNHHISIIEKSLSPKLSIALKTLVIKKNNDLLWMSRYVSKKEILRLYLSGSFKQKELVAYSDNLNQEYKKIIFEKFTDETIINYKLGSQISKKRMLSIANKLERDNDLKGSYNFLVDSYASKEYRKAWILKNIKKLMVIIYYGIKNRG